MKKIFEEFREAFEKCSLFNKVAAIGILFIMVAGTIASFDVFFISDTPLFTKLFIFLIAEGVTLGIGGAFLGIVMD